ncbi:Response regulator receiver protein [Planktothrix serta PCC 8927]|uniref:Response regulator receiver protein n=1 Tax=Planktothrix serta PCC 8927 TaxID=671068 RepID=A0A7Z9BZ80_9CYAN|nr:response regulator [Planktothrix serta]VXD22695.1 Response regulator receiver protein [Planktothrix serta PCC 8927]
MFSSVLMDSSNPIKENFTCSKQLLLIDDDETILEIMQSCFEEIAGWQVLTANNGEEGLLKALSEKPDAIILDLMMPGIDGLKFVQLLNQKFEHLHIPIVVLSAKAEQIDKSQFLNLGVVDVIMKPFDPFVLIEQIRLALKW